MNPELITRVVNLVQKSGDKVVLADPVSGKAVVVMDLEVYERLLAQGSPVQAHEYAPAPQPAHEPAPTYAPAAAAPAQAAVPMPQPAPVPEPVLADGGAVANAYAPAFAAAQAAPAYRPQPITPPAPPVRGPVSAEQLASAFGIPSTGAKKAPRVAQNQPEDAPKKGIKVTPETMGTPHVMADLTQEQLIDKINRDIGAWKTAQESRRTTELKAAASEVSRPEPVDTLEEEERFFLEPIE